MVHLKHVLVRLVAASLYAGVVFGKCKRNPQSYANALAPARKYCEGKYSHEGLANRPQRTRQAVSGALDFTDDDDDTECGENQNVRLGNVSMDASTTHQRMEGIGASLVFYTNFLTFHPNKDEIYDAIFGELKPTILRLRNSWDSPNKWQTVSDILDVDEELFTEAKNRLADRVPKVMLTSWSPPATLKKSGLLLGNAPDAALRKSNETCQFVYDLLAKFWVDGISAYKSRGIHPRWIAQNEPDYTAGFDSARMDASENYVNPGLFKAIDVIYDALHGNMSTPPGILGPETAVWDNNFLSHPYIGSPRVQALSGHLYSAGEDFNEPGFFDRLDLILANVKRVAAQRQMQQIFMTEYSKLGNHTAGDPIPFARTLYTTIVKLNVNMYCHWDLAWASGTGEGSLFLVDNPFDNTRETWVTPRGYYRTQTFEWFRHFSNFILPGMLRVECASSDAIKRSVKLLCFLGDGGGLTAIMLNFGTKAALVSTTGFPEPRAGAKPKQLFFSTLTEPFTNATAMMSPMPDTVFLRPKSITTLHVPE